jgi:predicted TIM-barrel fold metal-dependent hydrolase
MRANGPLIEEIEGDEFFVPVAVINPGLAAWKRDLQTCLLDWKARGVKIFPNYHEYEMKDECVFQLAGLASEADVPLCVQIRMMDERAHHPLMKVPSVPAASVVDFAMHHPGTRFLVCGALPGEVALFAKAENVWVVISFIEGELALRRAVNGVGRQRVVFGSHSPLHYLEVEVAKLDVDLVDVPVQVVEAMRNDNALGLLGKEIGETGRHTGSEGGTA